MYEVSFSLHMFIVSFANKKFRVIGWSRDALRWKVLKSPGFSRKYYCFEPP